MEHKAISSLAVKNADEGIVSAVVATTETRDLDGDWIEFGAFGRQNVLVSAYGHGSWLGELPVGKGRLREVKNEAVADLQFFLSTQRGRDHFETIKQLGDLQEYSFGFDIVEEGEVTPELREKGVRRVIKKVKVHEVSPVLLGAGIGTRTLSAKCDRCGPKSQRDPAEIEKVLRDTRRTLERSEALSAALKERNGPLAVAIVDFATRHLAKGRHPPMLRFFDPDGEADGYFKPRDWDAIYISRGVHLEDLPRVIGHEVGHWSDYPIGTEEGAEWAGGWIARLWAERYNGGA